MNFKARRIFFLLFLAAISFLFSGCKEKQEYLKLKPETKKGNKMIRLPAVAGSFYPADKTSLINKINSFLIQTKKIKTQKQLRILIVPHAGYDYSGQTAAWGFKQLKDTDYARVILVGPSHHTYFSHVAVYNKGVWQTPLGQVDVDEDFANTLINQSNIIVADLNVFNQEHSLEVELPFLQQTLKNFKIIPLLLSQTNKNLLIFLTDLISQNFDDKTLLVISSDFSHYPAYKVAQKVDKETINAILTGNTNEFSRVVLKNLNQPGLETCACGQEAIKTGMMVAQKLGFTEIKLINYSNSGDTGFDKTKVVGYASIGFYGDITKIKSKINKELNKKQQKLLLQIARKTLESFLKNQKIPKFNINDKKLKQKLGAFVTLRKNGSLRGCIGEFEPQKPLYQVVQDKAIDAAINDPRFSPVSFKELKDLKIEISVLSAKEKISDWRQIKPGYHGVVIRQGAKGGTFLPQVAKETGWDLKTFLENLCFHKAGLKPDCYQDSKTEIYVFTAQVFSE